MRSAHVAVAASQPLLLKGSMTTSCEERGRLAAVFYLAGGLVALVASLSLPAQSSWLLAVAGCATAVAVASILMRHRFTYGATLMSSMLGPVLIAVAIVAGQGGWTSAVAASLYAFVAVHSALVLLWRHATLVLAWAAATAAVAASMIVPEPRLLPLLAVFVLVCGTLSGVTTWLVQEMRRQAATDPLTGLANRATFAAALQQARATVLRTGEPLSLVALDLDEFKHLNDTLGHAAGDAMLVAVSRAWSAELRERDVLARLGGDEFCVILPGADLEEARHVAQRLADVMPDGATCSTGVTVWTPGQEIEALVLAADRALYTTKGSPARTDPPAPARAAISPEPS